MNSRYKAYTGKILEIDLTSEKTGEYTMPDKDRELFLGGRYLSTKILWDELIPGIDPLSADNILVIMTGPLTGTGAPSSSRYDISAKSPLTGGIGHSNSGGNLGLHLKKAGFDGIVIRGKAKTPVYIEIENERIEIKSAQNIWGKDTQESQSMMGKGGTLAIGPAGENMVKYASAVSQERSHGRCGIGAVMGSKNLKGIVARGSHKAVVHEPGKLKKHYQKWIKMLTSHPATGDLTPRLGTAAFLSILSAKNALPTKNFSQGTYADAHQISGEKLADEFLVKNFGCTTCPIRCGRVVDIEGKQVKGPEYEILCLLGSNMLINDMRSIIKWNYELDLLGIDSISVGTVMGFAAELNEKGLWNNGIEFSKTDNLSQIFKDIAYKKGIGADLAEGVRFLAEKYGGKEFAPHVKGLELPGYEPRGSVGHGLGYATANRGGCHLDGGYVVYFEVTGPVVLDAHHWRSKPGWVVLDQNLMAAIGSAGQCLFTAWTFVPPIAYKIPSSKILSYFLTKILTYSWPTIEAMLKLPPRFIKIHLPMLPHTTAIKLATGMDMDFGIFMQIGERGYTLEKLFNLREGFSIKDDCLAKRFTDEELIEGRKETKVPIDKMLPRYYSLRGWDEKGIPSDKTLARLRLDFLDTSFLQP